MLRLLILLQAAPAPCASDSLCRTVAAAAAANARAATRLPRYSATIETESALLARREGRIEGAILIEQTRSAVRWSDAGQLDQTVTGFRSFPNAIPLSQLSLVHIGWIAPSLIGQRIEILTMVDPDARAASKEFESLVHPLARDREKFYRYAGGEVVSRVLDGVTRRVIAIEVRPLPGPRPAEGRFEGEMDLDPESLGVVRLFGRVLASASAQRKGRLLRRILNMRPSARLIELINEPLPGGTWFPRVQRFEIQGASARLYGHWGARRVISRIYGARPAEAQSSDSRDTVEWHAPAGQVTRAAVSTDFDRFRPAWIQPTGRPTLQLQGFHRSDFLRYNRIEGLYTGLSAVARLRDRAPGVYFRATGGYAWAEKTGRGELESGWVRGPWRVEATAARSLEITSEFRNQFDSPAMAALFGRDPWDYVDRRWGGVAVARLLPRSGGGMVRLEFARVGDHPVVRHLGEPLLGGLFRENRNIAPGQYWRGRAAFEWNPDVSALFARDGAGVRAEVETGRGELEYTRVEGRLVARKSVDRFFVIARLHGGALFSKEPPPQQLFELGGEIGLPGYEYKEFAGNRAALFRIRAGYPLPILTRPVQLGHGLVLPALAPAVSVGFQAGVAGASSAASRAAVSSLGILRDEETGETVLDPGTGLPLPAAVPSHGLRSSIDIRVGIFGDALAVGLARALSADRKTVLIFAVGRQF